MVSPRLMTGPEPSATGWLFWVIHPIMHGIKLA
jgi:hypothetical protein